jgi:hypothetical protein
MRKNYLRRATSVINERDLTRADIDRWIRGGKSIKLGDTWYTITNKSSSAQALAVRTADWELERGKKMKVKYITFEDLLDKVNNGTWIVKINDKTVGKQAGKEQKRQSPQKPNEESQQSVDPTDRGLAITRNLIHRQGVGRGI